MHMRQMKCLLVLWVAMGWSSVHAQTGAVIAYQVFFKDKLVATQQLHFARTEGRTDIDARFEATLPVFVSTHHYREELAVSYRDDGTVEKFKSKVVDGGQWREVEGKVNDAGNLAITSSGHHGNVTSVIARADYDFNSLALYGTSPGVFLSTNRPARVLDIARGEVVPVQIDTITESSTFERQYLITKHLIWNEGSHISHSWHPEKFNDFPSRYIRQTGAGEFVFRLIR